MESKNKQSGFVLLYAVLVTMVVVAVGVLIMSIITKQIILSSIGKNSQLAFYAATAGVECAKYWDAPASDFISRFGDIGEDEFGGAVFQLPVDTNITCGRHQETLNNDSSTPDSFESSWTIEFEWGGCANVAVEKNMSGMTIKSQGYNIGTERQCPGSSPRLTERTIIVEPTVIGP